MKTNSNPYSGYRYPAEIISHAVWLYFRFALSYRDVEEILAARGIVVSYEAVRQWCLKFGQQYANKLRRRRGNLGDTWFLDEVFIRLFPNLSRLNIAHITIFTLSNAILECTEFVRDLSRNIDITDSQVDQVDKRIDGSKSTGTVLHNANDPIEALGDGIC